MKLSLRALRRRLGFGHAFGDLPGARQATGQKTMYRGYYLAVYHGSAADFGESAYEVKVFKGSWHHPEGNTFGPTASKACAKAKRLVDAMHGD